MTDRTADRVPLTGRMIVWDNNLDLRVVDPDAYREYPGPEGSTVRWYTCWRLDGRGSNIFDAGRLATRYPGGPLAREEGLRALTELILDGHEWDFEFTLSERCLFCGAAWQAADAQCEDLTMMLHAPDCDYETAHDRIAQ